MGISFGTSGLRAPAVDFDAASVAAFVAAFLDHLVTPPASDVLVGSDLRASSPQISAHVCAAVAAHGQIPRWCGVVPTPALAAAAIASRVPALMVTASHNPEDQNGIKFYRPDGELLKDDEAPIRARAERLLADHAPSPGSKPLPAPDGSAAAAYYQRFIDAFGAGALKGLRLGVYEHSAAGRDLLAGIFAALGAELRCFGRAGRFIAIDTEALDPERLKLMADEIAAHGLDAVVSTDGDGDRPLLVDGNGRQVNGDVLCTLAARALGIKTVVTPLTSTGAIELSGWFDKIVRTRIGSPYVVAAMQEQAGAPLAGFEANGGFLLGSDLDLSVGRLCALPTRDAVLPLVAVLGQTRRTGKSLAELVAALPPRVMKANRVKEIPRELSGQFLDRVAREPGLRRALAALLENPVATDRTDGIRFTLENGSVVHFRASGNAPELRLYVETDSQARTDAMLATLMPRLAMLLETLPNFRESPAS